MLQTHLYLMLYPLLFHSFTVSPMEGGPNLGSSPPPLEGDYISDVSMVNDSLLQHDSDVVIEEEREESMETDVPHNSTVPHTPEGEVHVGRLQGWGP